MSIYTQAQLRQYQPIYAVMNKRFDSGGQLNNAKQDVRSTKNPDPKISTLFDYEDVWMTNYFTPITLFMGTEEVLKEIFKHYTDKDLHTAHSIVESRLSNENKEKYIITIPVKGLEGGHFTSRIPDSVWARRQANASTNQNSRNSTTNNTPIYNSTLNRNIHQNNYKGNNSEFDPYNHYQLNGSNQFCQTYSLMYLLGRCRFKPKGTLLKLNNTEQFHKFYQYTKKAIDFIDDILNGPNKVKFSARINKVELNDVRSCIKVLKKYPYMCLNCADNNIDKALSAQNLALHPRR